MSANFEKGQSSSVCRLVKNDPEYSFDINLRLVVTISAHTFFIVIVNGHMIHKMII